MTITTTKPITIENFERMIAEGVFDPDERIELLGGDLCPMSPIGLEHTIVVTQLTRVLFQLFSNDYDIHIQNPIRLPDNSRPQPDAAVTLPRRKGEPKKLAGPAKTLLVVEVSDTTLKQDRTKKLPRYAASGIPEVWLIDANKQVVEQYHTPVEGVYSHHLVLQRGDTLATTLGPSVAIEDLLEVLDD